MLNFFARSGPKIEKIDSLGPGEAAERAARGGEGHMEKWFELPSLPMILTPRAGLRTQRAFFNAALALLGFVEGIFDVPDLYLG